jgi:hypothetical protein
MALFVHNKNQELLWTVINKTPIFQKVFANSTRNEPELWFRAHIQNFYQKIQYTNIGSQDLSEYNRELISIMMNNLSEFSKEQYVPSQPGVNNTPMSSPMNQYNNMQQLPYTVENKQEAYNRQFDERKREYDMMNSKPDLPKVDFGGNVKDSAISNMDELIKQHMQQRDAELQKYAPPPMENIIQTVSQLKIDKNENISLVPDVIMSPTENEPADNKSGKKVSWAEKLEEYNNTKLDDCLKEITDLKQQVLNMTNHFSEFQNEIRELIRGTYGSPGHPLPVSRESREPTVPSDAPSLHNSRDSREPTVPSDAPSLHNSIQPTVQFGALLIDMDNVSNE